MHNHFLHQIGLEFVLVIHDNNNKFEKSCTHQLNEHSDIDLDIISKELNLELEEHVYS